MPSLATAIGSSGDRPEALAELMGIIVNDGVKLPTTDLERLHFAAGTPYETKMVYRPEAPERVMAPEVAATVRRALMGVVAGGTATRLRGTYVARRRRAAAGRRQDRHRRQPLRHVRRAAMR